MKRYLSAVSLVCYLWLAPTTFAAIVAIENFDYSEGQPLSAVGNGGLGFSGTWRPAPFNALVFDDLTIGSDPLSRGSQGGTGRSVTATSQTALSGLVRDLQLPLAAC